MVELCRSVFFPEFYTVEGIRCDETELKLQRIRTLLQRQVDADTVDKFMQSLPEIKQMLEYDAEAVYNGDPAAESTDEVIVCYPAIKALTNYRVAHSLLLLGVKLIPRIIIIGNHVKIYQGVTLGAKSFPLDDNGHPIKGIPRHPIIEDNVIIYSNATVLGRITIAQGTSIGGNLWVTESTQPGQILTQRLPNGI